MPRPRTQVYNSQSLDGDRIWKPLDEWSSTYYSGLDCRIYFNDIFVDELLSVQYTLQEAVAPLFSYASYTYDVLMHGARRVQGTFTMNYKREGYLFELLKSLEDAPETTVRNFNDSEAFRIARTGTATVETFLALAARGGNIVRDERGNIKADPSLIRNLSREFETAIWNRGGIDGTEDRFSREFVRGLNERLSPQRPRFQVEGEFNISLQFGSIPFKHRIRNEHPGDKGQQERATSEENIEVGTLKRILGVALTGVESTIDNSGRNVLETYQFIARDVL